MKTDLTVGACIINDGKVLLVHHRKLDLWLPVGGHIDENETSDEALLREIKEEVGLQVRILNQPDIPLQGNMKKHLSTPFYVNVHSVGDHDHCCFFYVCEPLNLEKLKIGTNELKDYRWFSKEELNDGCIPVDVKNISLKAFELFENLKSKVYKFES
jgi:8-oxo-dGTP pyrophosphatase MutT (NUDIX family)